MSNRIKNRLFHFILTACFAGLISSAHVSEAKPVAVPVNDSYDFGEVYEGVDVTHDFIIKNTGDADLEIQKAKAG